MRDSPLTRPSLLIRLRDSRNGEAWSEFVDLYAPLIYNFARKHGLQDADAGDVTQEVLRAVAGSIRKLEYDPRRGSFRGWLFTIVRNELRDHVRRHHRPGGGRGGSDAVAFLRDRVAPEQDDAQTWDREYEQRLLTWAAEKVRREVQPTTWQAFHQTAIEGKAARDVAGALGITVAAVYLARRRVTDRLRKCVQELQVD